MTFATATANLDGWIGQPFALPIRITQSNLPYDFTGQQVTFVVEDDEAQNSLYITAFPEEGEIIISSGALASSASHAEWYITLGEDGPLVRGTFEFKKL